jgi:hypothetical protein
MHEKKRPLQQFQEHLTRVRARQHETLVQKGISDWFAKVVDFDPVEVGGMLIVRRKLTGDLTDDELKAYPDLEESLDSLSHSTRDKVIGVQCLLPNNKEATVAVTPLRHVALEVRLGRDELFPADPDMTIALASSVKELADELRTERKDAKNFMITAELVASVPFVTKQDHWLI